MKYCQLNNIMLAYRDISTHITGSLSSIFDNSFPKENNERILVVQCMGQQLIDTLMIQDIVHKVNLLELHTAVNIAPQNPLQKVYTLFAVGYNNNTY